MGKWDWLIQDAPRDPLTGGEYDPPTHDGLVLGVGCLVVLAVASLGSGAILVGLIL